jgi:hypothetical protein
MNKAFQFSHKMVVKLYQIAAVITLYAVLICVASYGFTMGFYALNKSWAAPFIVQPTNDKILDLTARMVTSQQALSSLTVDRDKLTSSLDDLRATRVALSELDNQFRQAITAQNHNNAADQPELASLNGQKKEDNAQTTRSLTEVATIEAAIDKDLAAGLITKGDAAMVKTQMRQTKNAATDGLIGEVLLRDSVRQKTPDYSSMVDALAKEAELRNNLVQLVIQITSGEEQLSTDKLQIQQLTVAVNTAKNSPYFLATTGNVKFAFVPYENQDNSKVGAAVYDCYLNMVACRKVGTIMRIFKDEERATHPIFKTDIRGSLVQLELTDAEAAKDKVLFIGRKPLLF